MFVKSGKTQDLEVQNMFVDLVQYLFLEGNRVEGYSIHNEAMMIW